MTLHLSRFRRINHFFVQFKTLFMSVWRLCSWLCSFILEFIFVSSANTFGLFLIWSIRSNMNIIKSIGPRTEPCMTPLLTLAHSERSSPKTALCFRLDRKLCSQVKRLPEIPCPASLINKRLCETLSKAISKSCNKRSNDSFSDRSLVRRSIVSSRFVTQAYTNPC